MNKFILLCTISILTSCGIEYEDNAGYDPRFNNDSQNELFQYAILPTSKVYATKNVPGLGANKWTGYGNLYNINNKLFFNFTTINNTEDKFDREYLDFDFLPIKEGTYVFKNEPGVIDDRPQLLYARVGDDGDVGLRGWFPSQYHDSYLTIEKIDSLNKKVMCLLMPTLIMKRSIIKKRGKKDLNSRQIIGQRISIF